MAGRKEGYDMQIKLLTIGNSGESRNRHLKWEGGREPVARGWGTSESSTSTPRAARGKPM